MVLTKEKKSNCVGRFGSKHVQLYILTILVKGQLTSKFLFGIFNSHKKRTKKFNFTKGQIKPKADWPAMDSPKNERMNLLFPFLLFTANKTIHLFVFWENLRRGTAFGFI